MLASAVQALGAACLVAAAYLAWSVADVASAFAVAGVALLVFGVAAERGDE